ADHVAAVVDRGGHRCEGPREIERGVAPAEKGEGVFEGALEGGSNDLPTGVDARDAREGSVLRLDDGIAASLLEQEAGRAGGKKVAHDLARLIDAGDHREGSAWRIERLEVAAPQQETMGNEVGVEVVARDMAGVVDRDRLGAECAGRIDDREAASGS